ncbi:hypothetical protein GH714_028764 [Hevea brasiliensis]|uniref:Glyceraldehyde 3-phosphate dehydrogenase NAD(P) binding domain-containing protein n=1 Tax=Hevea brasiliensis TaxID=3981 RepID=A0A6A6LMG8_HEVBR|nr:hypothetical protein GH714_028764 [Hevea brasiliensis]
MVAQFLGGNEPVLVDGFLFGLVSISGSWGYRLGMKKVVVHFLVMGFSLIGFSWVQFGICGLGKDEEPLKREMEKGSKNSQASATPQLSFPMPRKLLMTSSHSLLSRLLLIGRNFLRCWHGRKDSPLDVIAINDTGGVKQASHLLKYDSTLGIFEADVKPAEDGISVDGKVIKVVTNRNPINLPWKDLGIDLVIEGTGVFVDRDGAGKHIQAGAKKVLITALARVISQPTSLESMLMPTVLMNLSSAMLLALPTASLPLSRSLTRSIIKGTMTTTHSYTGDQRLLDASHRDLRRARAAALNIVPTSTGAAKAVALVLPTLKGKLNGIALRVPTPNVSVVDLVVQCQRRPLQKSRLQVHRFSSTVDSSLTMVMGDDMVKVIAWYDMNGVTLKGFGLADIVANNWK